MDSPHPSQIKNTMVGFCNNVVRCSIWTAGRRWKGAKSGSRAMEGADGRLDGRRLEGDGGRLAGGGGDQRIEVGRHYIFAFWRGVRRQTDLPLPLAPKIKEKIYGGCG